jgi:ABC-type branched-subunit amino acid transport system permease subunit
MRCRMAFGAGERLRYEIVTAVILFAFFELAPSADLSQGLAPLQAMLSFGFGGYIAGRVRRSVAGPAEEVEIRDGVHGLAVWALAVVLGTALAALVGASALRPQFAPSSECWRCRTSSEL